MSSAYDTPAADVTTPYETHNPPLFSASGRMGRLRYLAHSAWTALVLMAIAGTISAVPGVGETGGGAVFVLAYLASIVVQIIFAIKRVHDMNWPGIAAALALVPLVNLLLIFYPGTKGPNKYGPPPGPNTGGIIAGALILPAIFFLGILAAIAIPAYNDYTARAQVGEAFGSVSGAKTKVAEYYFDYNSWPDENTLQSMDLAGPIEGAYSQAFVEPGTGIINVTMHDGDRVATGVAGGTIRFEPNVGAQFVFECSSPDIEPRFLPLSCQE